MLGVLRIRNLRLLWVSSGIGMLGGQFYMIALPWLVLQLTDDAFAVGTVAAAAGVPRALFMLVGGALTDRFPPRTILIISGLLRMVMVTLLTVLVFTGSIELWMLYALAFSFGVADAFSWPASGALLPRLVSRDELQAANSLIQGTSQLAFLAGPVLAGGLIALFAGAQEAGEAADVASRTRGIAAAFGINSCTFMVSALLLLMMRIPRDAEEETDSGGEISMWSSIWEGLVVVWNDLTLRALFSIIAAINFLLTGPIAVGIPVLANSRLPEGAVAYGIIMSAFGGGALIGTILAGVLPKPSPQRLGLTFIFATSPIGIGAILLGFASSTPIAASMTLMMGIGEGYAVILFITWLQTRMPLSILGRMMSLVNLASVGLQPLSMALAGFLLKWDMTGLFVGAGTIMVVVVFASVFSPAVRAMGLIPEAAHPGNTAE